MSLRDDRKMKTMSIKLLRSALLVPGAFVIAACVQNIGQPTTRMGMVKQEGTGLMYGSVIERNLVTDASFYKNRKIKVRTRNTSGDVAFDLHGFENQLKSAYSGKGYTPSNADDFGLLVDVNVMYSGQVQSNLSTEFGFLGATAGGLAGASQGGNVATVAGVAAGAALGTILGSFVTDDTYIIVARVTFGEVKDSTSKHSGKTITFSRSPKADKDEDEDDTGKRGFRQAHSTQLAVFAGGRNTAQSRIAAEVRQRIIRIVSDFI